MGTRVRTTGLAGTGAMVLALTLSGVVAAAFSLASGPAPETEDPSATPAAPVASATVDALVVVDTTETWEDVDGNGIDDDCQDVAAVADPTAAASADTAVDLDADGIVSVSEGAQSERIGGKNCNHGGYVSGLAKSKHDCTTEEPTTEEPTTEPTTPEPTPTTATATAEDGDEDTSEDADEDSGQAGPKTCEERQAAKDARAAAKAEREAVRAAAKAEREAERAAAKAARDLAKAERQAAKTHGHGKP
jgi:hypothetical protein